ncbi:MAG TPA: hypothetical protein VFN09_07895 [Rhodanobacteraceae bacterium]|nr:hypothetical protein [Rhodanobacteraceae bacterium]
MKLKSTCTASFALCATATGVLFAATLSAQTYIPAGATIECHGGTLNAAGTSMTVDGALTLGAGSLLDLADFSVGSAGQAQLDSGHIVLAGNWSNQGAIDAGSSTVSFVDGGSGASALLGTTEFAALDFTSGTGKHYLFESGQTQTVSTTLTIQGTQAAPIQIDVTQPGAIAYLNLLAGGSQNIAHVGVSDVHANGQHLAPALTNEGGRGNDDGWFGSVIAAPVPIPVPATSLWSLLLLAGLLATGTALRLRLHGHRRAFLR